MTTTKPRKSERSAFAELDELDAAIAAAEERVPLIVRERRGAAAQLVQARGARERFYTWPEAEQNEAELERLVDAVREAEEAGARDWDDELQAAHEDAEEARRRRDEFLDENRDRLSADLIALATSARDRRLKAREELIAAQDQDYHLERQWSRVLGDFQRQAGGGDPRRPRLVDLPAPFRNIATLQALVRNTSLLEEAVAKLRQVDPSTLERLIPPELDAEAGGTRPNHTVIDGATEEDRND